MVAMLQRLDPDRRRRRLRVLAELSGARGMRDRSQAGRVAVEHIRALVATRRRSAG
jgi:hypothetical protein